jgi:integrase
MNFSKQYARLPISGKNILLEFKEHKDRKLLFANIIENIGTQKTLKSVAVRRAIFRGILRNYFDFADSEMTIIAPTEEQKEAYHKSGIVGFNAQHKDIVSEELIKQIINLSPICKLLIQSGLRVGELLDNKLKVVKGIPHFQLNKKFDSSFYPIHILGNSFIWIKQYRSLIKHNILDTKGVVDRLNIKLKKIIPDTFYKRSTHICRAIYASYVGKFVEPDRTTPQVILKYLHHDNPSSSVYYNHVVLDINVEDFLRTQIIILNGWSDDTAKKTLIKSRPDIKEIDSVIMLNNECFKIVKGWLEVGLSVIVNHEFDLKKQEYVYLNLAKKLGIRIELLAMGSNLQHKCY